MRGAVRRLLVVGLAWAVVGLVGLPTAAFGAGAMPVVEAGGLPSLDGPLVVPGVLALDGDQQELDAERVRRYSPAAFLARVRSRTEFEHVDAARAAQVAREAFPAVIDKHDGGAPELPAGERILGYKAQNVAQLSLPDRRRGVIESIGPMAMRTSSGKLQPIDLALKASGASFAPAASRVAVQIPKRLSSGVRASQSGVSLTPADAQGAALGGSEGSLQGASVLYANTQTDTDTLAKPTSVGFELSSILRSEDSPHELYYRVGLPSGASLVQHEHRGPIQVVSGGEMLGMVMPPTAVDAGGMRVPVSMSVKGDLLNVAVGAGEYQYPLDIDPEYSTGEDRSLTGGVFPVEEYKGGTNWIRYHSAAFDEIEEEEKRGEGHTYKRSYSCGPENWEWCDQSWYIEPNREYNPGEFAGLQYKTQGESTVYNLEMWLEGENEPSQTTTQVEYNYGPNGEGQDNHVVLSGGEKQERYKYEPLSMTSGYFHNPLETPRTNSVRIVDETTKHESLYGFWTWIWDARVYVAQEESKHPEAEPTSACPQCGFNTSSATIAEAGGRTNVLYGAGSWLSPTQGAYEVTAHDPGIGISFMAIDGAGMSDEKFIRNEEGLCAGIQCNESHSIPAAYSPSLANGEDSIELYAEDAAGLYGYSYKTIKVDGAPPEGIGFTGMPEEGAEISATPHTLTVHATDGKAPTPSSGVKSIAVSLDGGPQTLISGSCSPGPCTASGQYTLNAEALSEGVHSLTITATDNAGNIASKEFLFDVRHASPVSVGPGAVDPATGQFTLAVSDVSLGGASGVQRSYQSRNLTAGASGPLGPQWAMSVGGGEGLRVLPSGSVVLTSSTGGTTTFTLNEKGELEAPKGDESLKIEDKASERKYVLKDATAGSETVFEQPSGTQSTPPNYIDQFGAEGAQLSGPRDTAIDTKGNVWVTDIINDRIQEFSSAGTLLNTYGGLGQFNAPWGIAVNQTTDNIYITDQGNNRVVEMSPTGSIITTFGTYGSGEGQVNTEAGVAIDPSGNVWVADYGNNRIEEFTGEGKFIKTITSKAGAEFKEPLNIAFSGGNLYFTDGGDNRVEEFTTSGSFVGQFGETGSGPEQFSRPVGLAVEPATGNLYITDKNNNRIDEWSAARKYITHFGTTGSGQGQLSEPTGVAISASGGIYITDYNNKRVQEWSRAVWWPTSAKGSLPAHTTYTYAAVENSEGITSMQPYEVISPAPQGVECGTKLEELKEEKDKGCRALTFKYATETKAKGENESEWGEYKGHLNQVMFHAWNSSTKAMEEKAVAQYSYDKQGRLRAEWDPRMESSTDCGKTCSALKTIYGYDAEGHVTALTPPGQESWAFTYGTISGDTNTGRLLKVTRSLASAGLWNGEPVKNTEAPKLSGTPAIGIRMSTTNGKWSNSPIVYGHQWEDCNSSGKECTPILGATNANYTPASSDVGHTLVAEVMAANGGGSIVASSAASAVVVSKAGAYTQMIDSGYSLNAVSCIPGTTDCVLSDSAGKALYATNVSSSAEATWKTWSGPSGESPSQAVDCPTSSLCLLADGKETAGGKLYYATSLGGSFSEAYSPTYGVDALSCVSSSFCVDGQDGEGYFRYSTNPASTSWNLEDQGTASMRGVFCLSSSFCAIVDAAGKVHVGTSTSQIESSSWKETDVDGASALNGIACTSTTSCVAVDGAGNVLNLTIESTGSATVSKHDIDGTASLTAVTCTGSSTCIAVDNAGNVFVSKNSGETWTKEYALGDKLTGVSCASSSLCATADTAGKVTSFNPGGGTGSEGEYHAPESGSTIEYHVPLSGPEGSDLQNLTKGEVEKWGQKDNGEYEDNDPVEGMAVFPPDEPQGWPASDYKRATIDYMNEKGLTVNTASPTGGITTAEYNEINEQIRTLSADNRAVAMKEGCKSVSKKECKSAEVSEKLDTKTEYNASGSDILKVLGPEHKVKLSTGEEVEARAVTHNYYDEGAKEAEEKNKETYNLVTKTTSGALLSDGEERDVRTNTMSYSGQEGLGWKLRKPTSAAIEPAGLDLVHKTFYEKSTGDVIETRAPAGNSEQVSPPSFSGSFGSEGSGEGQFQRPESVAVDSSGDLWIPDKNDGRLEKLSSTGSFIATYGSKGKGNDQFENPWAIAINHSTGNIYVADTNNSRIEELNSSGTFVKTFGTEGSGKLEYPEGVAIDSAGDVWISDTKHNRIVEFSETGEFMHEFGTTGSGPGQLNEPRMITISEGSLYVDDFGNSRIEMFSLGTRAYEGQFGNSGSGSGQFDKPEGIATNPSNGDIFVSDTWNYRVEEFTPAGKFLAEWQTWSSVHPDSYPTGIAVTATGKLYIVDQYEDQVSEWLLPEAGGAHLSFSAQFGSEGTGSGQFNEPIGIALDGQGNAWVADGRNDRIEKFGPDGMFLATYGKEGSGEDEFKEPSGIAINKSTEDTYVADTGNNRIEEISSSGTYVTSFGTSGSGKLKEPWYVALDSSGDVWVTDHGNDRIVEFSSTGTFIAAYGKEGTGEDEFKAPDGIVVSGEDLYVADGGNHRVEELTTKGAYVRAFGTEGSGSGEFHTPEGIAVDAAGNLYVTDFYEGRIEEFSSTGVYKATFGSYGTGEGQLDGPDGDAIDSAGDLFVVNQDDDTVQKWDNNQQTAHDVKTVYYSAKEESPVTTCRNHPEWANLPCQVEPVAQPDHGLPELPVSTVTSYNIWDEAEKTEEKFGTGAKAVTRTKTETYDPAGRAVTSEEKAQNEKGEPFDTALPKVTIEYNSSTGAIEKESTPEGTIKSKYNTIGQLTEYSDASGNIAKYAYEEGGDGRLEELSEGKGEEAKSTQTFSYNVTTGFMEKLVDTAVGMTVTQGTFTASYDVEGKMISETYPNAMTATTSYNSVGQATGLIYEKTTDCASKCPETWFNDSVVSSIHGETLQQTSTLSSENYAYDNAGRLLEARETPAGKGCTTRLYIYDEESNRTSLTTRQPGTEGKCATEGGAVERHTYDEANRLTDEGIEYEEFGNITKLPAADAGTGEGAHELKSTYYLDGQVATQEQNKELIDQKYDPAGRTLEAASENETTKAKTSVISHYAGSGEALTWTSEGTEKWTRNIPGIDGALDAVQESGKAPILQLHDLNGDVVGTAADSESETKLRSTYNSTEFGVPSEGKAPPKYAWLGASGLSTETSFGSGVATQGGATYVPQVARALQTAPVIPPGAFPNGQPGTQYTASVSAGELKFSEEKAVRTWEQTEAERQKTKEREAAEALQKCREEGGCGAGPGNPGTAGGSAPFEGEGALGGGCSGGNACSASATVCNLHWLFGEPYAGELWLSAGVRCNHKVGGIQVEVCIMAATSVSGASYANFPGGCNGEKGELWFNASKGGGLISANCGEGWKYKGWAWAYAWGSNYKFEISLISAEWTCAYAPGEIDVGAYEVLAS